MKIHILANHIRAQRGEVITVEMLRAELHEVKSLSPKTTVGKMDKNRHVATLKAVIAHKESSTRVNLLP